MQIRHATDDDIDAAYELLSVQQRAAVGLAEVTRDELAQGWQRATTDRFMTDGGYAALDATQTFEIASRDEATNDALLEAVVKRASERGFGELHTIVASGDGPFEALMERARFTHHGDVLRMWRRLGADLSETEAWPAGLSVRGYREGDARAVQALLDDAYQSWDVTYVAREHDDWVEFMTAHDEFDPEMWFLAERDDEIVACALNWKQHQERGWVKDLVVREGERGRGLAKALLHHTFQAYAARGADRVGLKVDADNPTGAPQLYERVGFATDRRYGIWVKVL